MKFDVNAAELERMAAAFARAPALATQVFAQAMDESVLMMQREITSASPVGAGGQLRNSWSSDVNLQGVTVVGLVGTPIEYAEAVELGTRPHFPPVAPIQDWVESKLGLQGKEARSVAFAIATKISKVGTKPQYIVRDQVRANESQIQRFFAEAVQTFSRRLGAA